MGWPDSLDHYGLGQWVPGAEEGYAEDGGFGYNNLGFVLFGGEEEQGADQIWDGSMEGYQLEPAGFDAENSQGEDTDLHAWEWGGDPAELEISQEALPEQTGVRSSTITSSTTAVEDPSPSTDDSPAVQSDQTLSNNDVPSSSVSNETNSGEEFHCDFTNCGKSFTHRYKLKYVYLIPSAPPLATNVPSRHRKYHIKTFSCPDPSCSNRGIAFSQRKDLVRHQARHNGRRFYCQYAGCSFSISGKEGGFTRDDNLKRHIKKKH